MIIERSGVSDVLKNSSSFEWSDEMRAGVTDDNTLSVTFRTQEGDLIGSLGVSRQWAGVGTAWALMEPIAQKYTFRMTRGIIPWLSQAAAELKLWRVQATVSEFNYRSDRWLELMGFTCEARLRHYLPSGEHAWIFVKFYLDTSPQGRIQTGGLH